MASQTSKPILCGDDGVRRVAFNSIDRLTAALAYRRLGWSIIPMRMNEGKRPAVKWKPHQTKRAGERQLRSWFGDECNFGVAVVSGAVSGDLGSRDFDKMESYNVWAEAHPELAETLPTIATPRGRHVHFRADRDDVSKVRLALGKLGGTGAIACGDGELRVGRGCYSVLPPSKHPSGAVYRWINPPGDAIPLVADLTAAGLAPPLATDKPAPSPQPIDEDCGPIVADAADAEGQAEYFRKRSGYRGNDGQIFMDAVGLVKSGHVCLADVADASEWCRIKRAELRDAAAGFATVLADNIRKRGGDLSALRKRLRWTSGAGLATECDTEVLTIDSALLEHAGLRPAEPTQRSPNVLCNPVSSVWHELADQIELAIARSLPTAKGKRHEGVFRLARELKAVPELRDQPAVALRWIVDRWHERARPFLTKGFTETWSDFAEGWPKVKYAVWTGPLAEHIKAAQQLPLPTAAGRYPEAKVKLLVALCRQLQRNAGTSPFLVSSRAAGTALEVDHSTAARWIKALLADGVLRVAKPPVFCWRATEYICVESPDESTCCE